jgi:hypothetical protein
VINIITNTPEEIELKISGTEGVKDFKDLIARALNTHTNASPELKAFCDILEYGKPLQDYSTQK